MTKQVSLLVNNAPIALDYFVQAFIDHTVSGMIEALESTPEIKNLNVAIDGDKVTIVLNGKAVPINAFVNRIVRSTLVGMVSTLKGVGEIKQLQINITR